MDGAPFRTPYTLGASHPSGKGVYLEDVEDIIRWGTPIGVFTLTDALREQVRKDVAVDAAELLQDKATAKLKVIGDGPSLTPRTPDQ